MDTAGSTQVAYNVRAGHGFDLSIGVMIAGNSGRPGGAIYKPWFASPSSGWRKECTQATARRKRASCQLGSSVRNA